MGYKRIVVLANSIKRQVRCVAGMEIVSGSHSAPFKWVRPVSGESEGELEPRHMRLEGGGAINVLDVVEIPVTRHAQDPIHPEDWIVDSKSMWKRIERSESRFLERLEEKPKDLWLEPGVKPDRASGEFLAARPGHQSLYLIRPSDLYFEFSYARNKFKEKNQRKANAHFKYLGNRIRCR